MKTAVFVILFSNTRTEGEVHTQFADYNQILAAKTPGIEPLWLYANQPRGIAVEGHISVQITMPQFDGGYDYLPPDTEYVILLGYHPEREVIEALGIGQVNNHIVTSIEPLPYRSLDYIGYTLLSTEHQALLKSVAQGHISLMQALAELQRIQEAQ